MATQDLYEQWEKRTKADGRMSSLAATYQVRFGPMPDAFQEALAKCVSPEAIGRWNILFATASADEIAAAVGKGQPGP